MLSRDQVLHVARLARLELSEEELETMAGELSGVLEHIEKISELGDLVDVPPTSHVVAVENALRADEPRPSLPREVALSSAPDEANGGFRVRDLDAMLAQLRALGADVEDKVEDHDYGRFGWVRDPEGNRVELWQPAADQLEPPG